MVKFKKIISVLMVCLMGASFGASCASTGGSAGTGSGAGAGYTYDDSDYYSEPLEIVKSDVKLTPEQQLDRIKAEYLIKNKGYSDTDEITAILSLGEDAVIDSYLADEKLSSKMSLSEYASSDAGLRVMESIGVKQTRLVRDLTSAGLIKEVKFTFATVLNAISVTTTYGDFKKLGKFAGVERAAIADTFNRPQAAGSTDASAIVNAVDVYETGIFDSSSVSDLGITGKGTAVAVLDSGFDLSHPVFDFEPEGPYMYEKADIENFLAVTGENILNAKKNTPGLKVSDVWYSNKIPFSYDYADMDDDVFPYDSEHGTHVAGIIGGKADAYTDKNDNPVLDESGEDIPFRGVAVDTQLVLMKVFPDMGSGAEQDRILAALEDAVILGVDCINMSLGASCGFAREADGDLINQVYDKVTESGVSLITAAGNEYSSAYGGPQGNTGFVTNPDTGTIGSPASYEASVSVASISGIKSKYIIGNGEQVFFFNESNNIAGKPNDFFAELYTKMEWSLTDGAEHTIEYVTVPGYGYRANYTNINVEGKVAIVSRGDSTFEDKALQAKNAGAAACIIYNNIEGDILMSMGKSDHIPTISISREDGTQLATSRTGTLTFCYKNEAGPFMSDFSCWGPLPDLTLKPDITAHGGDILSSVPGGGFDQISGTSMACPNLCGVMVLIRQFLKQQDRYANYSWKEISNLANQMMMSTAGIVLNETGNPYSPRKQGAGLASLKNVVNTGAYLTVDGHDGETIDRTKLELMDDPGRTGVYTMEFNVVNVTNKAMKYDLNVLGMTESVSTSDSDHVAEKDQILSGNFTTEVMSAAAAGSVSGTTVTVNAGQTLKLKVTYTLSQKDRDIIENAFPYGMYVEGYVKLEALGSSNEDVDLNIPFLAYYGDWSQAPIFDKTYYEVETEAHNAGIDEEDKLKAEYFATTPYGMYRINYMIPLGTYLYDIDTSMYDPIPASEEHIAISDVYGVIDGISCVYAGLLRSCKTMLYTIKDKTTGEIVYEHEVTNARKAFSQGGSPIPNFESLSISSYELGLVNNRKYEFTMQGLLDYERDGLDTNVRNSFSFEFMMDNEAPIIKSAVYEKEYDKTQRKDRYYITLTVYDNHNVMDVLPAIFVPYEDSNMLTYLTDHPIPVYGETGKESSLRIEITNYLEDLEFSSAMNNAISFVMEDYALNQSIFVCQLPGTRGTFRFTEDGDYNSPSKGTMDVAVGEVIDLTNFLSTRDNTVDENKDYLKLLEWTSSNEKVARVQNGQVLGVTPGTAIITVSEQMNNRAATIRITVYERAAGASARAGVENTVTPLSQNNVDDVGSAGLSSLRFTYMDTIFAHARAGQTSDIGDTGDRVFIASLPGGYTSPQLSMYPAEQVQLHYDLDPWYVADKYALTFESSNEKVATITSDGVLTAIAKGTATITLRAEGSNIMARLRLTVNSEFVIDEARTLVAYKGWGGEVVIPDDEGILYVGPFAFCLFETDYEYDEELPDDNYDANKTPQANRLVTSVVVPEGVIEIQKYAFYNCFSLKSVTLPKTVKFIREFAFFEDVMLESINLEKVEAIGVYAFAGCEKLNNIDLSGTYAIAMRAFMGCESLTSVDLSALRNAGDEAFRGCTALTEIKFDANGRTKLSNGIFAYSGLKSVTIYEKVNIPAYAFAYCDDLTTIVVKNDLVSVGEGAFSNNPKLNSVTFEGSVEVLGAKFLANNPSLTEITLPNSAFSLGNEAFSGCENLTTLHFGAKTRINEAVSSVLKNTSVSTFDVAESEYYTVAFDGKLLIEDSAHTLVLAAVHALTGNLILDLMDDTKISSGAFSGADITSVKFVNAISIGAYAFANCSELTSVTFPAGADCVVAERAFEGCGKLAQLNNFESVVFVGDYAFAAATNGRNAITSVTIGAGATIGEGAFLRAGLTSLTIGENVTIGVNAFMSCTNLTEVIMPAEGGVTLETGAFRSCTSLATIDLSTLTEIADDLFRGCTALKTANLTNAVSVGSRAFADCRNLSTVTLPKVESIGARAFAKGNEGGSAPSFTQIDLPETLTELGEHAFDGCTGLSSVSIPSGITALAPFVFANCTALKTVTLPAGLETIGSAAFMGCDALTSINLGKVKVFGDYAFSSQYMYAFIDGTEAVARRTNLALNTVDLASAVTVGTGAFAGSSVQGNITAPNLTSLGDFAFYKPTTSGYSSATVTSFDAPKLEYLGIAAFYYCTGLTQFKLYDKLAYIGTGAFYGCNNLTQFTDATGSTDAVVNGYVRIIDGVLYTTMPNGKLMLASVPAAKNITTLTVEEGTAHIDSNAGNLNTKVMRIVLPDSLESIGDYAFYGYTALRTVEFRSSVAPNLESTWEYTDSLSERDPGYELLHSQYSLYSGELGYHNFIDLVGKRNPIQMVLPANEKLSGYDSLIYLVYFGSVEDAERSDYVAMEQAFRNFLNYYRELPEIENITMAHDALISNAVAAMNAIKQDPTQYGYTAQEWKTMTDKVTAARTTLARLKIANAKKAVRDAQALIDALPDTYVKGEAHDALLNAVTNAIQALDTDDRSLLLQEKYNSFLAQYNAANQGPGPDEEKDPPKENNGWKIAVGVSCAVVAVAIAVVVALVLVKKRKNSENSENGENVEPDKTDENNETGENK